MILNVVVGVVLAAIGLALAFPATNEIWFYSLSKPSLANIESSSVGEELIAMGGGSRSVTKVIRPTVHVVLQSSTSERTACDIAGLYEVFGDAPVSTADEARARLADLYGRQIVVHAIFSSEGRPSSCRLVKPDWPHRYVKAVIRSAVVGILFLAAAALLFGDIRRRSRKRTQ